MDGGNIEENHDFGDPMVDSNTDEEMAEQTEIDDYNTVFEKLKSKWLLTEIHHSVSKTASEAFWRTGLHFFPKLESTRGRKKKTSQFKTIRKKIHNNLLPEIKLEIAYKHRSTGEITVINDSVTPSKRFPLSNYEKLYEIGSIKVRYLTLIGA